MAAKAPSASSGRQGANSSAKFPAYVADAMAVAEKHTKVPVLGPLWLPTHAAAGSAVGPKDGTFSATVQSSKTQYTMQFWYEPHALPVNNPDVGQDSTDPGSGPLVIISGERTSTRSAAKDAVLENGLDNGGIPKDAKKMAITSKISGEVWTERAKGYVFPTIAWHEQGWLLMTSPPLPSSTIRQAEAAAVASARRLISKVRAPMPGQAGTVLIEQAGDGEHTDAMWQRGKLVYSVFANYGLSPATTVVGSLYPAS